MRCAGSSLLPICRDRRYGNIYFLLGRERRHPQWIDSDQWADFSGSTKTTNGVDESSEETAAREAWEETAAIVKFRNQFETVPVPGYDSQDSRSLVRALDSIHPFPKSARYNTRTTSDMTEHGHDLSLIHI